MSVKKGTRDTVLYEIGNKGPQKLPNFAIWEQGKYEIRNMEEGHLEIWTRESTGPVREHYCWLKIGIQVGSLSEAGEHHQDEASPLLLPPLVHGLGSKQRWCVYRSAGEVGIIGKQRPQGICRAMVTGLERQVSDISSDLSGTQCRYTASSERELIVTKSKLMPICNYIATTSAANKRHGAGTEQQRAWINPGEGQRSGIEDFISAVFTLRHSRCCRSSTLNIRCEPTRLTPFPFNSRSIPALLRSGESLNMFKDSSALADHATPFPLPADRKRPVHAPCRVTDTPFPFSVDFPNLSGRELVGVQWKGGMTEVQPEQIERIQKQVPHVILPGSSYREALLATLLQRLAERRADLCRRFATRLMMDPQLSTWLPPRNFKFLATTYTGTDTRTQPTQQLLPDQLLPVKFGRFTHSPLAYIYFGSIFGTTKWHRQPSVKTASRWILNSGKL